MRDEQQTWPAGAGGRRGAIASRRADRQRARAGRTGEHVRPGAAHQDAAHRRAARRAALFQEGPHHRRMERRRDLHGEGHRQGVRRAAGLCRVHLRQLGAGPAVEQGRPGLRAEPDAAAGAGDRLHPPDDHPSVRLPGEARASTRRPGTTSTSPTSGSSFDIGSLHEVAARRFAPRRSSPATRRATR